MGTAVAYRLSSELLIAPTLSTKRIINDIRWEGGVPQTKILVSAL